ncbi:hypothetical protein MKW98_009142 [Papaver atlanticum]|uniref:Uncharacterized protein n=1 Tax=Papaver atlanticum TaxID=357466 RepID=A0AAD4T5K6_9MAGN|nr:hypothetical protein MKW98_009142 [Papaver atlanticum]
MAPRKQQLPNKEIDKQNCTTTGEVITLSDDEDQDVESLENLKLKLGRDIKILKEELELRRDIASLTKKKTEMGSEIESLNNEKTQLGADSELLNKGKVKLQTDFEFPNKEKSTVQGKPKKGYDKRKSACC